MSQATFRSLLSSEQLFQRYWTGQPPAAREVELLLLVTRHQAESLRPDGHHRSAINEAFPPWQRQTLANMLNSTLYGMVEKHLSWESEKLYISKERDEVFSSWQNTITEVPSLPLLAHAIWRKVLANGGDERAREILALKVIGNSLQPSLHVPLLDDEIRREGLHELHMHLNGTTEPDLVWLHAIGSPRRAFREFQKIFSQQKSTQELLLQVSFTEILDVYHLLRLGAYLRDGLALALSGIDTITDIPLCPFSSGQAHGKAEPKSSCPHRPKREGGPQPSSSCRFPQIPEQCPRFWSKPLTILALKDLLRTFRYLDLSRPLLARSEDGHPLAALVPRLGAFPVQVTEAMMLGRAYDAVAQGNEAVAAWLHAYLVVQTKYHRLLVQQADQIGFEQFQKIPDNKLRDPIEQKYAQRFQQLRGMYGGDLASIEGRFSPGATTTKTARKIHTILSGFNKIHSTPTQDLTNWKKSGQVRQGAAIDHPELRLVAHFIKREDPGQQPGKPDRYYYLCRHHKLRQKLMRQASALAYGKEVLPKRLSEPLVGIDACANEMHASPEVFAPAFRMLRERGFPNCTFHAGEDFMHLLSGIRAVYEALEFLDLQAGDRIGHATALGIDPDVWLRLPNAGMKLGEWYDNVVFAYYLLTAEPEYAGICQNLANEAARLHVKLFNPEWRRGRKKTEEPASGSTRSQPECAGAFRQSDTRPDERYRFDMQAVIAAWKLRGLDPLMACYGQLDKTPPLSSSGWREWWQARKEREENPRAFDFFQAYHFIDPERWNRIEKPSPMLCDLFKSEVFTALQRQVLKEVKRRGVLLESMPTSNVRISYYNSYTEHHILEWLGLGKDDNRRNLPRPMVAICTDNPGIFPTTLRNEFCHVFQMLIKAGLSEDKAIEELQRLNRNARAYRFGSSR